MTAGFGARSAWLYMTLLSIGYMISRGLAKASSRGRYDAHPRPQHCSAMSRARWPDDQLHA